MRPFLPFLSKLVADRGTSVEHGVPFGAHQQRLDIFRPLHAAPRAPIILFLHGGAWIMGSRAEYFFVGTVLAARGYTTIIADYRKYPKVRFPAFVEDAAAAYRWTAETFASAGQNRPIIVMGHSAGAHSAALLALDQRYLAGLPAPAGLIGFSGPYAMDAKTRLATRAVFAGTQAADLRPSGFARPDAPPALLIQGKLDMIVRPANAVHLAQALADAGSAVETMLVPGMAHLGVLLALARPLRWRAPVLARVLGFLEGLGQSPRPALPAPGGMLCTPELALAPPRATPPRV